MLQIPKRKVPQRELVVRLRALIDRIMDPEYRVAEPAAFAMDYHRLLALIANQPDECSSNYVRHNIGRMRSEFIAELITKGNAI